jgi:hypothetical protein
MKRKPFTSSEDSVLMELYPWKHMAELETVLGRSAASIKWRAKQLGLNRPNIRKPKLDRLLPETNLNAYWWGLIYSDGHLTDDWILKVKLWHQDKSYLDRFAEYLGVSTRTENSGSMIVIETQDKINGPKLKQALGMNKRKTENPPQSLDFLLTEEMLLSFFIGIVDGDGNISRRKGRFQSVKIQVHGSWLNILNEMSDRLHKQGFRCSVKMDNRGSAGLLMCGQDQFKRLTDFIGLNALPVLERKWTRSIDTLPSDC